MICLDLDETLVKSVKLRNLTPLAIATFTPEMMAIPNTMERFKAAKVKFLNISQSDLAAHMRSVGAKIVTDPDGEEYTTIARPFTQKFIQQCQTLANTIILTNGKTQFQTHVCEELGIKIPIYGRDTYSYVPKVSNPILIEDLGYMTSNVKSKIEALGLEFNDENDPHYLHIEPWDGSPNDRVLTSFFQEVKTRFELLSRTF